MKADEAAGMIESRKEEDQFKQRAAVVIAFFAMLLAITGLGGNAAAKEAFNSNILASNYYSFFQAKTVRQTSYALAADQIELAWLTDPELPSSAKAALGKKFADYRRTVARWLAWLGGALGVVGGLLMLNGFHLFIELPLLA